MTIDEIDRIEQTLRYHANNCGGCETCYQCFGDEPLTFDERTVWELVQMIRSQQAQIQKADELADYIDTYGFEDDTQSALLIRAYRNASKKGNV